MTVLETDRLTLRHLRADDPDAAFILRLVNDPSWLRFIGDRGIKTLDAARQYIETGPRAMYERLGYGLFLVEQKSDGQPVGICGLLKRESLDDAEIGFALLPEFWGRGYAFESAAAALAWGRRRFGFSRLIAITAPHNAPSGKLLEKLGFRFERALPLPPKNDEVNLYAIAFSSESPPVDD